MTNAGASRRENSEPLFATPEIVADRRADGAIWLKSTMPLRQDARCVGDWLEQWAPQSPERIFLGERSDVGTPWTTVTYRDALRQARSGSAWILAQRLSAEHPLVIPSDNSIEHALFALAAMHVGVPAAAISPAYSLVSKDFDKLKSMIGLLDPGAIYVSNMKPFAAALAAIKPLHRAVIVGGDANGGDAISFQSIVSTDETEAVAKAFAAVTLDSIAKFLFTSGSTGTPKADINTQRMLTSSQQARAQTWPFLEGARDDLVILDWLPWSHTFGANHNFNLVLRNGGSLYIEWRQTGAGPVRYIAGQSAQRDADGLLQCAARLRHADRGAARRRRIAPPLLWRSEIRVLCRGGTAAESLGCHGSAGDRDRRPRAADGVGLGLHRDLAAGDRLPFPGAALRQYRRADTRHRIEVCTVRRQARWAGARDQRHAGLLEGAGTDRAGVRRRRILSDRRCRDLRRSGSPGARTIFRRPCRRGFQAQFRHLGQRRHAACRRHRRAGAAGAGHRHRGPWRRSRALFGISEHRRVPRAGRLARRRRCR